MTTSLRIDEQLYREAKAEAARQGITITRFLEEALKLKLNRLQPIEKGRPHPFRVADPGTFFAFSTEEIKRIANEEQEKHDLAKLGFPWKEQV
ncbi:MAG: hypothetical protein HC904_13090 [Blastochloris sp.]|nr:hypothetical protein [Blastochloris sp.]